VTLDRFYEVLEDYDENSFICEKLDSKTAVRGLSFHGSMESRTLATNCVFLKDQVKRHINEITSGQRYILKGHKKGVAYKSMYNFCQDHALTLFNELMDRATSGDDKDILDKIFPEFNCRYLKPNNCYVNLYYFVEDLMKSKKSLQSKYDLLYQFNEKVVTNYYTTFCKRLHPKFGMDLTEVAVLFLNSLDDSCMEIFIREYIDQDPDIYLSVISSVIETIYNGMNNRRA